MPLPTGGVHHISGIGGRPQQSIEFYYLVLGLRLVKRTVNYDDPATYHLYFGDASGQPGSVLTLFAWPGAGAGHPARTGTREVTLRVPPGSLPYWRDRLERRQVAAETQTRLGREHLVFTDPDGLPIALVEGEAPPVPPAPPGSDPMSLLAPVRYFPAAGITPENAVTCVDAVTFQAPERATYVDLLTGLLAFVETAADEERVRLVPVGAGAEAPRALEILTPGGNAADGDGLGSYGDAPSGGIGRGSYHHVAFEVEDETALEEGKRLILSAGLAPTKVKDRTYFKSVYFSAPGGAVLELATRGPGFTADEPLPELGLAFKLPEWLEPERQFIRSQLPVTASPEYADLYRQT